MFLNDIICDTYFLVFYHIYIIKNDIFISIFIKLIKKKLKYF